MADPIYKIGDPIGGLKYGKKITVHVQVVDLPAAPLKAGDANDKVTELQNALVTLHRLSDSGVTGTFDAATAKALGAFQHDWGFKTTDGYDNATRLAMAKALNGEKPAGNVHDIPVKPKPAPKPVNPSDGTLRDKIVKVAMWGYDNRGVIHYEEVRPILFLDEPWHLPLTTDCSGFATLCYKWAGAADPNGNDYRPDPHPYTGTMLEHMRHIDRSQAKPGDLVVYGPGTGEHVCILIGHGSESDPMVVSHGQEAGPLYVNNSVEADAHDAPTTWLSILD